MSQGYETFGKYILLEKLAVGGMAEIYLARSSGASGVGKFVAIKRILPQFTEQTEFIDMFKDEAKIAVNLSHANVVGIYEFGLEKNSFFLAMDYIEGRNLRQILNKMKKSSLSFSIEQVLYIIKEVAGGLDHAHRCIDANTGKPLNIIHRDMSPQNVMVSFEGEVKIVDFGIAKAETQLETTRAGTLKGKFGYMSPEQAEGQPVDLRTDVFALGIVLWELLANDRLFVANNEVNTLRKIRDCQVPSLRKINPNIAPELERIVGKALAKDRNLRYQTSAAFHRDLSRFLNRQYPDFSPQDFSVFVKTLFAGEILESRKKMVDFAQMDVNRLTKEAVQLQQQQSQRRDQDSSPVQAQATYESTVVTNTQDTVSSTQTEDQTGSGVDFENQGHRPTPKQTEPSVTRPAVQAAQVKPAPAPKPVAAQAPAPAPAPAPFVRPEAWQQQNRSPEPTPMRELPKKAGEEPVLSGRLVMDRSAFRNDMSGRDGTYAATRSMARPPQGDSSVKFLLTLVFFGLIAAAGAYYFANPTESVKQAKLFLAKAGVLPKGEVTQTSVTPQAPVAPKTELVEVYVSSAPSGAPISVNGTPTGEVTPGTIKLEKGKKAVVSLKLAGYLPSPYEERFVADDAHKIDVRFKADVKGFLNIIVAGEGQIYVNDVPVASTSPARMIPVAANEDVRVMAYDPKTRARDEKVVTVGESQTVTVKLEPKAGIAMPQQQAPAPTQNHR
jgi:serine/threonine protein kinase